jgi:hypothetical protein
VFEVFGFFGKRKVIRLGLWTRPSTFKSPPPGINTELVRLTSDAIQDAIFLWVRERQPQKRSSVGPKLPKGLPAKAVSGALMSQK